MNEEKREDGPITVRDRQGFGKGRWSWTGSLSAGEIRWSLDGMLMASREQGRRVPRILYALTSGTGALLCGLLLGAGVSWVAYLVGGLCAVVAVWASYMIILGREPRLIPYRVIYGGKWKAVIERVKEPDAT